MSFKMMNRQRSKTNQCVPKLVIRLVNLNIDNNPVVNHLFIEISAFQEFLGMFKQCTDEAGLGYTITISDLELPS
jgi:hypothetical protein